MSDRERRRFARAGATWPAIVELREGLVTSGEVVDVSLSGMKVRMGTEVAVGMPVMIRVALPHATGRIEVLAKVVRQDRDGIGVHFLTPSRTDAELIAPFLAPGDIRRWSPRVPVSLPVRIQVGTEGTVGGTTLDLSVSSSRVATDKTLTSGDVVVLELQGVVGAPLLRLLSVVWEAHAGGAVLIFTNVSPADSRSLGEYVNRLRQGKPAAG